MNRAKEKLQRGGTVLVFNPNFPSASLVEHAGGLGFDVAFIDCEHGSAGFERAEELARAARAAGMTSILRPWSREQGLITRFLDCGVGGIQFPGIDDAAAAREAVGMVRAARGDRFTDTLVTVMIESKTAMENLPGIVAVEGLDAVVVGLSDLAASLGHPGENRHPEVRRARSASSPPCAARTARLPDTTCITGRMSGTSSPRVCAGSPCTQRPCLPAEPRIYVRCSATRRGRSRRGMRDEG